MERRSAANNPHGLLRYHFSQQPTQQSPVAQVEPAPEPMILKLPAKPVRRYRLLRLGIPLLAVALLLTLYLLWHSDDTASTTVVTQQSGSTPTSQPAVSIPSPTTTPEGTTIQVYVVGAVKHPGVYTLSSNARMYQLLEAAGGALPQANLVSLNLAAHLSDGQEVYVPSVNETPPTVGTGPSNSSTITPTTPTSGGSNGQLVNINTASSTEMRQQLHVSSTTAQNIINYRTQHGSYTAIDQLLQVVSQGIYAKIKDLVTI